MDSKLQLHRGHPEDLRPGDLQPGDLRQAELQDITTWLESWSAGDGEALSELIPLVYGELRRLAYGSLRGERSRTLQPTSLVHEAFLKLQKQNRVRWQNRSHFFAVAATLMRRIIVDYSRSRLRLKRGGEAPILPLEEALDVGKDPCELHLRLEDALRDLATFDPDKARLVELRFYAGLSLEQTAGVLGSSRASVVRHWNLAKAWLYQELVEDTESDSAGPPSSH